MKKFLLVLVVASGVISTSANAQDRSKTTAAPPAQAPDTTKPKKPAGITDKVKAAKKVDGMFTVYQDTATGTLQLYVKKDQLGKEYIYQSFSINGPNSLFLNQSMHRSTFVFKIQKSFDKLEFVRINNSFYYDSANAISKTKNVDKPQAVFTSERISGEDSTGYLINGDALFLSEKMDPVKPVTQPGLFTIQTFNLG